MYDGITRASSCGRAVAESQKGWRMRSKKMENDISKGLMTGIERTDMVGGDVEARRNYEITFCY